VSAARDYTLDGLFELDGEIFVVDPNGDYWVKFMVKRVKTTPEKPHGLDYSLTLHGPSNERIVGYDNDHPVPPTRWGDPQDHRHTHRGAKPYIYLDAAALLEAFWADVDRVLRDEGITK
jgi:hypothetical protein